MAALQCSTTPYDHLRYRYPETWKNLMRIYEKNAAPTTLKEVAEQKNKEVGYTLEGPHWPAGGPPPLTSTPLTEEELEGRIPAPTYIYAVDRGGIGRYTSTPLTEEETQAARTKKEYEKDTVHQLKLLKNTRRNPFGGWYEGLPTNHKISQVYNEKS